LGLSIVQRIVEAHGGTIAVNDNSGGGAVFTIQLKRSGDPTISRTATPVPSIN
jgi:signal transduction histidine kinase